MVTIFYFPSCLNVFYFLLNSKNTATRHSLGSQVLVAALVSSPSWLQTVSCSQNPAVADQRASTQAGRSMWINCSELYMILSLTFITSNDSFAERPLCSPSHLKEESPAPPGHCQFFFVPVKYLLSEVRQNHAVNTRAIKYRYCS